MKATFQRIYATNVWGDAESRSGLASNLVHTKRIQAELPKLIQELNIAKLLDIPCGDFFWMRHVNLGAARYIGADIVPDLIQVNQKQFSSTNREFRVLDITADELPQADLILCRDCFIHFSNRRVKQALRNLKKSRSRYLLTTTFPNRSENEDTFTGGWRPISLNAEPFRFPPPLRLIAELDMNEVPEDSALGLWSVDEIPTY